MWLMLIGLFAMIVAFWWVVASVLVTYLIIGRLFCAFAFAGNLAYGAWTRRVFGMSRSYWFMFNLLAIGPMLFCLFFGLNALFATGSKTYLVSEPIAGMGVKAYWIDHGELPPVRWEGTTIVADPEKREFSVMRVSRGLFAFKVIGWREPNYLEH